MLTSLKGLRDGALVEKVEEMGGVEVLCLQLGTCQYNGGCNNGMEKQWRLEWA